MARATLIHVLVLVVMGLAAGCSFDIDRSENLLPPPVAPEPTPEPEAGADGGADGGDVCNPDPGACDCIQVGDWYRFTALYPTSLGGDPRHPLVLTLKNLWIKDIDRFELNVMFEVTAVEGDRITVVAMNGARGELGSGEVCGLPETRAELVFERDPCDRCRLVMPEPGQINIYAGSPEIPRNCAPTVPVKHTIPVTRIALDVQINDDCSELTEGVGIGAGIPESALPNICTCPGISGPVEDCEAIDPAFEGNDCNGCNGNFQNLQGLMIALNGGRPVPMECPDADGNPGVCIDAYFTAARWPEAPPECPLDRVSLP